MITPTQLGNMQFIYVIIATNKKAPWRRKTNRTNLRIDKFYAHNNFGLE